MERGTVDSVLYAVEFSLKGSYGKNKATVEKCEAFRILYGDGFRFIEHPKCFFPAALLISMIAVLHRLFRDRPRHFIYRGAMGWIPFIAARWLGIKAIVECHASYADESRALGCSGVRKFGMLFGEWSLRLSMRFCSGAIFNNRRLHAYYSRINPRIKSLGFSGHNGTDTKFFVPGDMIAARRAIGLPMDGTIFSFVGSKSVWHGVDKLKRLSRSLGTLCPDVVVLMCGGTGATSGASAEPSGDNLYVMGSVDKEYAVKAIQAADACLLPVNDCRISPGSPLKLFDYASCGKPIITQANVTGYSDIVGSYGIGHCIDFNADDGGGKQLAELLLHNKLMRNHGHIRSIAVNYFDWNQIISQWIRFSNERL